MTVAPLEPHRARVGGVDVALLGAAFAAAVAVRAAVAGPGGAASVPPALVFAALLAGMCAGRCPRPRLDRRSALAGSVGALVLAAPVVAGHGGVTSAAGTPSAFAGWALATAVVATAEEAFLRGALFDALARWRGSDIAVVGAAVAFAALHVPLYGWHVVPLDLAVGLGLGALRLATGSWAAPAVAHVGADLVGWWFV